MVYDVLNTTWIQTNKKHFSQLLIVPHEQILSKKVALNTCTLGAIFSLGNITWNKNNF